MPCPARANLWMHGLIARMEVKSMEVWIRQSMAYHPHVDGPMPFPVPGWMWDHDLATQLYGERMPFIQRMEECGFDGIIFTEHHYGPNGGLTPSPIVVLSAATQATSKIKLVTMGIQLASYPQPVRVAEELALVDHLSKGRLVVGLISTVAQTLYALNMKEEEEQGRYHESYDLLIKAWTDPNPFEWHGEYYDYPCVSILPRPYQQPHPPIWTTARADQSIRWAAENHIGFVAAGPTDQCTQILDAYQNYAETEFGWTPTAANRAIFREVYVAPTKASFEEKFAEIAGQERENAYPREIEHRDLRGLERGNYAPKTYTWKKDGGRPARGVGWGTSEIKSGHFLLGDPETLTRQIIEQQKETNAGVLVIRPEMGNMSLQESAQGMELFAKEVLPEIRKL
jgi:alkanesulfonate monooxygenase SsuD/methylene tetrahydromethanopterin reductase-like flavin-dependent oxidoreductase (luciferase family)